MTSTTAYGTVVTGERIEDTTPLIATGYSTELHAADVVPMYYRPSGPINAPIQGSTYQDGDQRSQVRQDAQEDRDPYETCAMIGCFFSCIPIIGILNFCFNSNARKGSMRLFWRDTSVIVSLIFLLLGVAYLFYPIGLRKTPLI